MAYASTATLKTYLGISETTDDTLLGTLLTAAQAMIDAHCRQTFEAAADTTRYFDPTQDVQGRTLFLDMPLSAITSVTNGDSVAVTSGQYVKEPRNGSPWYRLTLKSDTAVAWTYTSAPENAIAIVGKWAYSESAPADIAQTTVRLAAYLYRQRDNTSDLDRTIAVGSNAMLLPSTLPKDIVTLLRPYVRLVV